MDTSTASIKVARDYFKSSQNTVLIPNRDFGKRKFIHVGINSKASSSKLLSRGTSEEPETLPSGLFASDYSDTSLSNLGMRAASKQWVHPPEALLRGHIVYNVKFLGESEVDSPKGTDVVKDAIRKRKFNKHIKKAEGQKPPKVELTISADGVTVQDPKTKMIRHQYALHRISYCADDKSDKRMFTFIAKAGDTNQHYCYVFDSEKCAEEITLTIGQAFDLAYRKFLDNTGKDLDLKKQYLLLQKKVHTLEKENLTLRLRVQELEKQKDMDENQKNNQIYSQISDVSRPVTQNNDPFYENSTVLTLQSPNPLGGESTTDNPEPEYAMTSTPQKQTTVGRSLENLLFESDSQTKTNGVSSSNGQASGILSPPPPPTRSRTSSTPTLNTSITPTTASGNTDIFGSPPFVPPSTPGGGAAAAAPDPFGMGSFAPNSTQELDRQIMNMDKELLDLQTGFNQGLSFGTEDFSLADLDPLN